MLENDKEVNGEIKQDDNISDNELNVETAVPEILNADDENAPQDTAKIEPDPEKDKKTVTLKFLYPAIVLASISVIVALLLAVLNSFTAEVIANRKIEEQNAAIKELFGNINPPEAFDSVFEAPVNEILKITNTSNEFIGYCVSVSPKGFGGKINMLVAIDPDGEIIKIKILDMSETVGIGTKVETGYFLEQFAGKRQGISANSGADNSIDTISGATISSSAVLKGINAALDAADALIYTSGGTEGDGDQE